MRKQRLLLSALLAAFMLSIGAIGPERTAAQMAAPAASSGQVGKPAPAADVTSTIFDQDSLGNPLQLQSDDLNIDLTFTGQPWGIYHTDSSTSVSNQIGSGSPTNDSRWTLDLSGSTSRSINLTFSRLPGFSSGFTDPKSLHAVVLSQCFNPDGGAIGAINWFTITSSDPNCSMRINFTVGKTNYALVMSPFHDTPLPTGRAIVTCTQPSPDGKSCSGWSVLPNQTQSSINPNPGVANLYSISRNGTFNFIAQYALAYNVNVVYP